ncbi:MAG: NADH-quinone oxidoreductase subunit L [Myxococcales bacterium]|nr:NADH-quinone oxidoreductase subunit L [Myxococcales bacterium]
MDTALALVVLLPLMGAIMNGLFGRFFSRRVVNFFAIGSVLVSFLLTIGLFLSLRSAPGEGVHTISTTLFTWIHIGSLHIPASFQMDQLSAVMTLIVTGVGFLIHVYSTGYMSDDPSYSRYFCYLNLFMFSMLILVLGGNLAVLFVGWEGVGLCSYLLIGFWFSDEAKAAAGQKAFVTNRVGDLGFLIGMLMLLQMTQGSLDFDAIENSIGLKQQDTLNFVTLMLFVGAMGKSAQIPLYIWLPDAMAGPTPVSALIHAATMVTAGVYMVARLSFMFAVTPLTLAVIAIVGGLTAIFAASIALTQRDIKKVLAYSTVSQLGFMFLALGVGAFSTAIFHLTTHAFFKACLFLGAGAVIHALHGEQDGFKMGGLKKHLPVTRWTFLLATLAIAGLPPLAGFFSKDEILWNALSHHHVQGYPMLQQVALILGMVAALFTAFYMMRLYLLIFHGSYRGDDHALEHLHKPSNGMKFALIILGVLSLCGGFMGIPHGDLNIFAAWLAPMFSETTSLFKRTHPHSVEYALMAVSTGVALVGVGIAYISYKDGVGNLPKSLGQRLPGVHALLLQAYKVDALLDLLIKRPFRGFARFCHRVIDAILIDGVIVTGTARVVAGFGAVFRRIQTGDVQHYALLIVLGMTTLLYLAFI